jgi:putative transposase
MLRGGRIDPARGRTPPARWASTRAPKSQVSRIRTELDEVDAAWRNRPLDAGPYPFVWIDALSMRVRGAGRIGQTAVLVATGVNHDGQREILGLDIGPAEDGAPWTAFLRGLVARTPEHQIAIWCSGR